MVKKGRNINNRFLPVIFFCKNELFRFCSGKDIRAFIWIFVGFWHICIMSVEINKIFIKKLGNTLDKAVKWW